MSPQHLLEASSRRPALLRFLASVADLLPEATVAAIEEDEEMAQN